VSLLLRRPPGRGGYPGDVFYLHSRLLERCAKLNDELGAGSMTGLPVIETKGNDVSAYIRPTSSRSPTASASWRPTCSTPACARPSSRHLGVSCRCAAQSKAMRSVAGRLRVDLAQYRELEAFAAIAPTWTKLRSSSCPGAPG